MSETLKCVDKLLANYDCPGGCSPTGSTGSNKQITAITEANGKVLVMLDDGTYLSGDMSLVDDSLKQAVAEDTVSEVKQLQEFTKKLKANLEPVADLSGEVTHYSINKDILGE